MALCPLLAALALALAAAPPADKAKGGGATAAAPDPELQLIAGSLARSQRAAVEAAVGSLAGLPRYRLDLDLDPEAHTLRGAEQISVLRPDERLHELWLRIPANAPFLDRGHGRAVSVSRVAVNDSEVELVPEEGGLYRVSLESVPPGTRALVEIDFFATIPQNQEASLDTASGLINQAMALITTGGESRTDYGVFGWARRTFNLAGFAPEIVRREAGIFDTRGEAGIGEPRWGALGNWVVSLVAPPGFLVAGTGVEVGNTPERDGRRRTTRAAAAVRSFALVAGEGYAEQREQAGEVQVRVIAPPGHAAQAKKLLHTAARAVRFFSERAGAYPWAALEIAEAPLSGAMEATSFPTFLMVSPVLTDPGTVYSTSPGSLVDSMLEMGVAHHVAHQWWRGVVGSDNHGRPVLDEPMAMYSAILYVEHRRGAAAGRKLVDEQLRRAYRLRRTLGGADDAVDRPLHEYGNRLEIDALLRGKGALWYLQVRKLVGDRAFFAAFKQAATANRFKEVDADPLLLAVAGTSPGKAEAALKLYDRYMRQTKGDQDIGAELDPGAFNLPGIQIDQDSVAAMKDFLKTLGGAMPPMDLPPAPPPAPGKKPAPPPPPGSPDRPHP